MSSVIELYEHNQKAYDALLDMLGERDRACIIKPTGTGKFVIIAKMVQDNPDKRFLLLGTNDYMFNDQMANLAEIAPGFTPENLQFMTYAAAMGMERRNDCVPPYDVIIADEFHHCGAEEWGKGVTHILNANESAKVVGFTATPIRYSDGGRNMADEMFDGNVAYSMELEEAWLRGILPIPKYVTAFYEAPEELGRLAKSIAGLKNERVMKRFQKKYEQLRRSLTEAGGVREIIAKHLEKRLDERFRPTVKTEWPHASAVNGIYPEDVADLPTIETAIPRLRKIFAGADEIIGYNVGFDLGFLSAVGVRPREDARITDTMNEFTWFMGRRYKLVDAADHIGYEWTGRAHGSLADARATLAVQRWLEQWLVAE